MEELANDPIISFYTRMSNSTDNDKELPVFSETMLRLSFKEVFGPMRLPKSGELQLYRKLLLFNYSEKYPSITDLFNIMTCFDKTTINEYFDEYLGILDQWRTFLRLNLNAVLYKEALNEILYEYTKRYLSLFGTIDDSLLQQKAKEIHQFLRCGEKLPKTWNRSFNALLNKRISQTKFEQYENLTEKHLEIASIYKDIKKSLNILVVEAMKLKTESEPAKKKIKLNEPDQNKILHKVITAKEEYTVLEANQTELDTEELYEIDDNESIANVSDINVKNQTESENNDEYSHEILEQVDFVDSNSESEEIIVKNVAQENFESDNENEDNFEFDKYSENDGTIENIKSIQENDSNVQRIVNDDTAMSYLAALQAYAVVNGHFEAIGLLDKVDSLFRQTTSNK